MKNMLLAVALVAGFAACRSDSTKAVGDDSSANVPAAAKEGCCAEKAAAAECTDKAKAECATEKKACSTAKPTN